MWTQTFWFVRVRPAIPLVYTYYTIDYGRWSAGKIDVQILDWIWDRKFWSKVRWLRSMIDLMIKMADWWVRAVWRITQTGFITTKHPFTARCCQYPPSARCKLKLHRLTSVLHTQLRAHRRRRCCNILASSAVYTGWLYFYHHHHLYHHHHHLHHYHPQPALPVISSSRPSIRPMDDEYFKV